MSNIISTFPLATVVMAADGSATGTFVNADGATQNFSVTASQLNGIVLTAACAIDFYDDGEFGFTTPEFTVPSPAPTTFPTLTAAIAAIGTTVTAIDTTSGVPIAVVNGAVDPTQVVTAPLSDWLTGTFTLVTTAPAAA